MLPPICSRTTRSAKPTSAPDASPRPLVKGGFFICPLGWLTALRKFVGPAGPTPRRLCGPSARPDWGYPSARGWLLGLLNCAVGALRPPALLLQRVSFPRPPGDSFSRQRVTRRLGGGQPPPPPKIPRAVFRQGFAFAHPSRQRLERLQSLGPGWAGCYLVVTGDADGVGTCRRGASRPPTRFLLGCSFDVPPNVPLPGFCQGLRFAHPLPVKHSLRPLSRSPLKKRPSQPTREGLFLFCKSLSKRGKQAILLPHSRPQSIPPSRRQKYYPEEY